MSTLHEAIEFFGGISALARRIVVSPQVVDNWVKRNSKVPIDKALIIEVESNGKFSLKDFRPDIADLLTRAGYVRMPSLH